MILIPALKFFVVAEVWCKQNLRCLSNRFGPEVAQGVKRAALLVEETSWDEGLFENVFVCFFCCFDMFFLMGNTVIVGQEGKGDVYIFWVGIRIGEIRGVSLQCNGVYPLFVRRSFSCSQIVISKNSSQSCFSMRIFELNHLINGMIFFFSKKHLEDHPIDILKKDHFPKKS